MEVLGLIIYITWFPLLAWAVSERRFRKLQTEINKEIKAENKRYLEIITDLTLQEDKPLNN